MVNPGFSPLLPPERPPVSRPPVSRLPVSRRISTSSSTIETAPRAPDHSNLAPSPLESSSHLSGIQHVPNLFQPSISAAEEEWALRKVEGEEWEEQVDHLSETGPENESEYNGGEGEEPPNPVDVIESLMNVVPLEEVKEKPLAIKSKIEICHQQEARVKNAVFQGNQGTGMYNFVLRG